jgi:2-methylaconitate cis-trans-isomerase PrpF
MYEHYLAQNTQHILYILLTLSMHNFPYFPSNPTYKPSIQIPRTPDPSAHPITAHGTDPTPLFGRSHPDKQYTFRSTSNISTPITNKPPKMFNPFRKLPHLICLPKHTPVHKRALHSKTKKQHSLPAAYYRGGTSRAVFFKQSDLPPLRKDWAPIFRNVIGSPDPYGRQLDGLGGGISSLSKVCVVSAPTHADADVDYTFVSLGVKNDDVDYSSNCGNMISAVGPFAVDSRLFPVLDEDISTEVRIHNTNTGKIIRSSFPVVEGEAAASGDFAIDGVAGTAARVQLDFVDPAGSVTGVLLPTGSVTDDFDGVRATCIDVGNPCVFVRASELGVEGDLTPEEIAAHVDLLPRLDSIRRQAGVKMGIASEVESVPGSVPKICMVAEPDGQASRGGELKQTSADVDLLARALSVGQPHKAVPITVALALAAAARVDGSTVAGVVSQDPVDRAGITIGHASGNLLVGADFDADGALISATVFRTARRLFEGMIYWKNDT